MPGELFQPNASTHTAIAVFETNLPHNNKEVVFFNLEDDGFVLSKNRGRADVLNKWNPLKKELFMKLNSPDKFSDNLTLVKTKISSNDEWIIQAHSKTDYTHLSEKSFVKSIKQYLIFNLKFKLNLLNKDIDEITLLELLDGSIKKEPEKKRVDLKLEIEKWAEFNFNDIFKAQRGKRLIKLDQNDGDIAYISSTKINNGIDNYISPPDYMVIYNNAMTLNNSGSVGYVFYHNYEFVASDHCTVISILDETITLNNYIAIFLKPIIEAIKPKYNFAREISDYRLNKERISLPTDKKGNPDWSFMEEYIRSLPYSSSL